MRNAEIAERLRELGDLYELDGAVSYRVLAYRQAAKAVAEAPTSIAAAAEAGTLTELPGIGETIAAKIAALLAEGEIPAAAKLKRRIPPTLVELLRLPGIGAKTVRRLHDELGVVDAASLRDAAQQGRLSEVKGLGEKTSDNVLRGLAELERSPEEPARRLLPAVLEVGEELAGALRALPACEAVEIAGSARRWVESCKDLDLIAAAADPAPLVQALVSHPRCGERRGGGEAGVGIVTHDGLAVDLRVCPPRRFGNLLQHFTGSARHNVLLREDAVRRGLRVSELGIVEVASGDTTECATEDEVYERLGYAPVPPELREGRGELEAAREGRLPPLVGVEDLRGELHCHTTLSDGRHTLGQMAEAAAARGLEYLAVTDHSASHGFGNEVSATALRRRVEELAEAGGELAGVRVLAGSEVNILADGSLDYPDELLAELDWVIASVHTSFSLEERAMTERVIAAIEHPLVDCVGHLTGRLIGRREPYAVDVERVVGAAAEAQTMLEINGNPNRRDVNEHHARLAAEAGVLLALTTDAHRVATLANQRYAVATARRAWLGPEQVANARSWSELSKLRPRRRVAAP